MGSMTRRTALIAGAGAALPGFAAAQTLSAELAAHPGYRAWTAPPRNSALPLNEFIETETGPKRLRDWLDGRPSVLALWATWCGPCLIEKPHQARMARRLAQANARARIMPLQAYDNVDLVGARRTLDRLGARALPAARATESAEAAFVRVFGASSRDRDRTAMPSLLLIAADGSELGRAVGTMPSADGSGDYWEDEATFSFLSQL